MDSKAVDILFNTFWSSSGWKEKNISNIDFEYAKNKGIMFDSVFLNHSEIVTWLIQTFTSTKKSHVVKCFVSSLSARRMDWRSGLSAYAYARHFPNHSFMSDPNGLCRICGNFNKTKEEDLNILNFERLKWGGVRYSDPLYVAFSLSQINQCSMPQPNDEDLSILKDIVKTISSCNAGDRPIDIEKRLTKILKSNSYERRGILDTFGICGIMETSKHKGYFEKFVNKSSQILRPVNKTDWEYPVDWWTGADGINKTALQFYFSEYLE